jgi:bifunctional non-homologous end joining protein LigD
MECLPVEKIPEGDNWTYGLKLDGYRLQAVKAGSKVILYSRRGIDLTKRYEYVAMALAGLPDDTVIDVNSSPLMRRESRTSICFRTSGRLSPTSSSMRSTCWFTTVAM